MFNLANDKAEHGIPSSDQQIIISEVSALVILYCRSTDSRYMKGSKNDSSFAEGVNFLYFFFSPKPGSSLQHRDSD